MITPQQFKIHGQIIAVAGSVEVDMEIRDWRGVDGDGGGRFQRGDGVGEETEDDVCGGGIVE
ncbi:hypothetical protein MTR_3g116595 [Medicago truncatula]|uniref:Uncharacterized protein n=1 Tax=Medicago truncatula TaxID=3880 RepID=A0A072V3I6_MEDTR|nr:hypothetical protein MTR_3g116595 [Medicago truncatula]